MHQGKNHLIWQVARRLTANYFEKERECVNNTDYALKVIEVERTLDYKFKIQGTEVKMLGNVDRVDVLENSIRIIDYKSGMVEQKDLTFTDYSDLITMPKKAKAFQLMSYAYLYAKNNHNEDISFSAGNYSLRNLQNGILFVKHGKNELKINALVIQEFEEQLIALLSTILNEYEEFEPTDNLEVCKWCDFKKVCGR